MIHVIIQGNCEPAEREYTAEIITNCVEKESAEAQAVEDPLDGIPRHRIKDRIV